MTITKSRRWALLVAAAVATPVPALVFLAVAAMGFKSASPLFWTIPQSGLHPMVLAPAIAIINSLGTARNADEPAAELVASR